MIDIEQYVRDAYLAVLGREVDPVGLTEYCQLIASGKISGEIFRTRLMSSIEYRGRYPYHPQGRQWLNDIVSFNTKRIVQSGPFRSVTLLDTSSRGDGDVAPKLLGTYEQDLHPYIERFSDRKYDAVVDIGCAEGYYAIGLAKLFPNTPVFAFDTDKDGLTITRATGVRNGCSSQISTGNFCDAATLRDLFARFPRMLIIVDCEGYEKTLFSDPLTLGLSVKSDLIIECHDLWDSTITPRLTAAFSPSHKVSIVYQGSRNPNVFPFLSELTDWERWLAVWERREGLMNWLICEPKSEARTQVSQLGGAMTKLLHSATRSFLRPS